MARILVIDDEPELVRGLEDNLRFEGHETTAAAAALAPAEGALVWVIDDEVSPRAGMQALLASWGYEVRAAASGAEMLALHEADPRPPRAILCDYRLRGEDSVSVIARRGSPLPAAPSAKNRDPGRRPSTLIARRMRGAPMRLASPEESVAAKTPASTSHGTSAWRFMVSAPASVRRSVRSAVPARTTGSARYTRSETPTAANVPSGRLLFGSFRSPDIDTPCVKPVIADRDFTIATIAGSAAMKPEVEAPAEAAAEAEATEE